MSEPVWIDEAPGIPRPWETQAMAQLPAGMVKGMLGALSKQPAATSVEPFWHMSLAAFGKSAGQYELEVLLDEDEDGFEDQRHGVELPFPVAEFQACYELLQRLVKRGHEVKLHHVGDPRFDALVLWVKA